MKYHKIFTEEFLKKEYVEAKKPKWQICRDMGTSPGILNKYLKKFNIPNNSSPNKKDLTGKKFGHLLVVAPAENDVSGKSKYLCKCDCGKFKTIVGGSLSRGLSKSCGCIKSNFSGYKDISGVYWRKTREHAVERNYEFTINIEEAWDLFVKQNGKCILSGLDIRFSKNQDRSYRQTASIDRIDSNKGYTIDNIQWVHKIVNFAKQRLSDDEFITLCQLVANFHPEKRLPPDFDNFIILKRTTLCKSSEKNILPNLMNDGI